MKVQLSYKALVDGYSVVERSIVMSADSLRGIEESKDVIVKLALKKEFPGKQYDLLFSTVESLETPVVRQPTVAQPSSKSRRGRPNRKEVRLTKEMYNALGNRKDVRYTQLKASVSFETFDAHLRGSDSFKDLVLDWRESNYDPDERPCTFLPEGANSDLTSLQFVTRREINTKNGVKGAVQRQAGHRAYWESRRQQNGNTQTL